MKSSPILWVTPLAQFRFAPVGVQKNVVCTSRVSQQKQLCSVQNYLATLMSCFCKVRMSLSPGFDDLGDCGWD
jgi:hypothetical protein